MPMPRSTQRGKASSSGAWSSSVYGIATRKKSSSKRSRKRPIIGPSLMPAPKPLISPAAFSSCSARRPPRLELAKAALHAGLVAVIAVVDVVDHQEVDPRQAEALQAVLVGAHHAVVAVVEAQLERQAAGPEARAGRRPGPRAAR